MPRPVLKGGLLVGSWPQIPSIMHTTLMGTPSSGVCVTLEHWANVLAPQGGEFQLS